MNHFLKWGSNKMASIFYWYHSQLIIVIVIVIVIIKRIAIMRMGMGMGTIVGG